MLSRGGEFAKVLQGAGVVVAIRVAGALLLYLSQIILARWMGKSEFGIFSYVWAWVWLAAVPAGLGLPSAAIRFIPQYRAAEDWARLAGFLRFGGRLSLVAGCIVATVVLALATGLKQYIAPEYFHALVISLLAVPVLALILWQAGQARAFQWLVVAFAPEQLVRPLVLVGAGAILVGAGGERSAQAFVGIGVFAYFVAFTVQKWMLQRRWLLGIPVREPVYEQRDWLLVSLPLLLVVGSNILLTQIDLVIVGIYLKPEDVAVYTAAVRTATLVTFFQVATNAAFLPRGSHLFAQQKVVELWRLLAKVALGTLLAALLAGIFVILLGERILGLFGETYAAGTAPLTILVLGFVIVAGLGPVGALLNVTGQHNTRAAAYATAATCNLGLNLVLVPVYGIRGAAFATALSLLLANVWSAVAVLRRLPAGRSRES